MNPTEYYKRSRCDFEDAWWWYFILPICLIKNNRRATGDTGSDLLVVGRGQRSEKYVKYGVGKRELWELREMGGRRKKTRNLRSSTRTDDVWCDAVKYDSSTPSTTRALVVSKITKLSGKGNSVVGAHNFLPRVSVIAKFLFPSHHPTYSKFKACILSCTL